MHDSVEEKGTIVKKKPPVNVWSVCDELAIIHKESRSNTNKQLLWIYQYCVYFDKNLTKIEAVVKSGICTHDLQEGVWDFRFAI